MHPPTLAVISTRPGGSPAALLEGDAARERVAEVLGAAGTIEAALDRVATLQGPPLVLEAHRRGQSVVLPRLPCVVELRRGDDGGLTRCRVLDDAGSTRALSAAVRVAGHIMRAEALLGRVQAVASEGPHDCWLALGGTLGLATGPGGQGLDVLSREALLERLAAAARAAATPAAIESRVAAWCDPYLRREEATPGGGADIRWRLPPLAAELHWLDGQIRCETRT